MERTDDRLRWDSEAWQWTDLDGVPLTFDEVEDLGLDGTGRLLG